MDKLWTTCPSDSKYTYTAYYLLEREKNKIKKMGQLQVQLQDYLETKHDNFYKC